MGNCATLNAPVWSWQCVQGDRASAGQQRWRFVVARGHLAAAAPNQIHCWTPAFDALYVTALDGHTCTIINYSLPHLPPPPPLTLLQLHFAATTNTHMPYASSSNSQQQQLDNDGAYVAYIRPDANNVNNVFVQQLPRTPAQMASFNTSIPLVEQRPAAERQVTFDAKRGVSAYSWAEDDSTIFYLQDTGGDENFHLWMVPVSSLFKSGGNGNSSKGVDLTPYPGVVCVYVLTMRLSMAVHAENEYCWASLCVFGGGARMELFVCFVAVHGSQCVTVAAGAGAGHTRQHQRQHPTTNTHHTCHTHTLHILTKQV